MTSELAPIDHGAVLRAMGLDVRDAKVQALVLICERYELDPILSEACLINGRVFITKAGLRRIAERTGDLDGIEVEIEERQDRYVATARVWRRSMNHPFTFTDECLKSEKVSSPRKRAHTRAVRNALKEAFAVGLPVYDEDDRRPSPPIRAERAPLREVQGAPVRALPSLSGEDDGGEGEGSEARRPPPIPRDPYLEWPPLESEPVHRGRPIEDTPPLPDMGPVQRSLMAKFREMGMPDGVRHAFIGHATAGRTESVKDVTNEEAGDVHLRLHRLNSGELDGLPALVLEWVREHG